MDFDSRMKNVLMVCRFVVGAYDIEDQDQLIGTMVTPKFWVVCNNDVTEGPPCLKWHLNLMHHWPGWRE